MTHGTFDVFSGVRIIVSEYACTYVCKVEPWPTRKRRRNWRVVRHMVPGAYTLAQELGGGIAVHPTIYAQLKRELQRAPERKKETETAPRFYASYAFGIVLNESDSIVRYHGV